MDFDTLTAPTIAAGASHCRIQGCFSLSVLCVDFGAVVRKKLNDFGPTPKCCAMKRRLTSIIGCIDFTAGL